MRNCPIHCSFCMRRLREDSENSTVRIKRKTCLCKPTFGSVSSVSYSVVKCQDAQFSARSLITDVLERVSICNAATMKPFEALCKICTMHMSKACSQPALGAHSRRYRANMYRYFVSHPCLCWALDACTEAGVLQIGKYIANPPTTTQRRRESNENC